MSKIIYVTCDDIGLESGGGKVTYHELRALNGLGTVHVFSNLQFADPFAADDMLCENEMLKDCTLAHFYAGTFSKTIKKLKEGGTKITYTAAAHDIESSRNEHIKLGLPYDYPHLTEPNLWNRYISGYRMADIVICPSKHSADCMQRFKCERIEVVPHGVDIPERIQPVPKDFTVGYLGAVGPDKGLIYLLHAWKHTNIENSTLLLAGPHSKSHFVDELIRVFGGGNIKQLGWVDSPADLYNQCSVYVQPSITEGFGCEVLEAMAYGRPVICSTGAGAVDTVPNAWSFPAGDVDTLINKLKSTHSVISTVRDDWYESWVEIARKYTWEIIESKYANLWSSML